MLWTGVGAQDVSLPPPRLCSVAKTMRKKTLGTPPMISTSKYVCHVNLAEQLAHTLGLFGSDDGFARTVGWNVQGQPTCQMTMKIGKNLE